MNGLEFASEIKLVKPELAVTYLFGRELPIQTLALVNAFVSKLEASQQLLPVIAEFAAGIKSRNTGKNALGELIS